jgi:hypothetical protein
MLKLTGVVIHLPTDIDQVCNICMAWKNLSKQELIRNSINHFHEISFQIHFLEQAKRGGMAFIGTRHLVASENEEICYIDANVRTNIC